MSEEGGSPKEAKARAKADKAFQKASRPWFKKKRFWALGIIVIFAVGSALGGEVEAVTHLLKKQLHKPKQKLLQ